MGSNPTMTLFALLLQKLKGELKDGQIAKKFKNVFET